MTNNPFLKWGKWILMKSHSNKIYLRGAIGGIFIWKCVGICLGFKKWNVLLLFWLGFRFSCLRCSTLSPWFSLILMIHVNNGSLPWCSCIFISLASMKPKRSTTDWNKENVFYMGVQKIRWPKIIWIKNRWFDSCIKILKEKEKKETNQNSPRDPSALFFFE